MVRLALAGVVALTLLCAGVSEEVRKQPLVVPDESGRVCVYSRDVKSMKWWKLQIVKDYSVCNDFSRSRCIYDRELRHCIPKMLLDSDEDVVSSPPTVEECKKRCATVSCLSRCEGMGFDDAPAGTKEKTTQKGMGMRQKLPSAPIRPTSPCEDCPLATGLEHMQRKSTLPHCLPTRKTCQRRRCSRPTRIPRRRKYQVPPAYARQCPRRILDYFRRLETL